MILPIHAKIIQTLSPPAPLGIAPLATTRLTRATQWLTCSLPPCSPNDKYLTGQTGHDISPNHPYLTEKGKEADGCSNLN